MILEGPNRGEIHINYLFKIRLKMGGGINMSLPPLRVFKDHPIIFRVHITTLSVTWLQKSYLRKMLLPTILQSVGMISKRRL